MVRWCSTYVSWDFDNQQSSTRSGKEEKAKEIMTAQLRIWVSSL
jgi:hypothetical protein